MHIHLMIAFHEKTSFKKEVYLYIISQQTVFIT